MNNFPSFWPTTLVQDLGALNLSVQDLSETITRAIGKGIEHLEKGTEQSEKSSSNKKGMEQSEKVTEQLEKLLSNRKPLPEQSEKSTEQSEKVKSKRKRLSE